MNESQMLELTIDQGVELFELSQAIDEQLIAFA